MSYQTTARAALRPLLAAILAMLAGACGEPGPSVDLRLHLRAGDVYRVWTVTEQTTAGADSAWQAIGLTTTYRVESLGSAGIARVRVSYDSASFASGGSGGRVNITSADTLADIPPAAAGYLALVGHGFTMMLAPNGQVARIDGGDELRRSIAERLTGSNKFMAGVVDGYLRSIFSDSALRASMEQSFALYPARQTAVGDRWKRAFRLAAPYPMALENEYELASRSGGIATVEMETAMESYDRKPDGSAPSLRFDYDLTGKQRGRMMIRESDGWVIESNVTQEFSGTIRQGDGADSGRGAAYPVDVRGSTVTKLLDPRP